MKKLALTSLLAVFAVSGADAATKYFVGGNATIGTDNDHATVLSVAPEFGWKLNSNWDLGVAANFGVDHKYLSRTYGVDGDTYTYGAGAFARYKVAQMGGVKLLLKGSADLNFMTAVPEDDAIDSETLTTFDIAVVPMITYDLTESFTLYANLNFLGLNAGYRFENEDMGIDSGWRFNAFADSDNVANTGGFQIGFLYNF